MTVEGHGKRDIARALTADKILIPAAYAAEHCPENNHSHGYASPYEWSCTAVSYILEKQEYMGHTVLGKTVTDNFKTKKRRKAKPEELIKKAIHTVSSFAIENEGEFIRRLKVLSDFQVETAIKENKKALSTAEKRVKELDGLIRKLYEGNATGKIPDKHFERMLAEYDSEQGKLEGRIEEIKTPMLNEFIEKIVVHEADKSGGRLNRKQKVDIYFNFVGQIDLSEPVKQEESTDKPAGKKKAKVS